MIDRTLTSVVATAVILVALGVGAVAPRAVRGEPVACGTALVLAVDVSGSVDANEYEMQKAGIVAAMNDPAFHKSIWHQPYGRMAVIYVEWSATQAVVVPWTILETGDDAVRFGARIEAAQRTSMSSTGIGEAITFAAATFAAAPCRYTRAVIDVSGDGINNNGTPPDEARDAAVAAGIIINGLPISDPSEGDVAEHYRQHVAGGVGSFVVEANGFEDFARAIHQKLVLEIASAE